MHEYEAGIIRTEFRGGKTSIIHLLCEEIAREVIPGQFVQVHPSIEGARTGPFLRRPFSICGVDTNHGHIKLLVEVAGHGTELICAAKHGECLNIIGPLGAGFERTYGGNGSCILVAGGIGAAPLLFLADTLRDSGKKKIVFMIGARTGEAHKAFEGLFGEHVTVMKATDDGSIGFHGTVSGLLEEHLRKIKPSALYTCGPLPMMKSVAAIAHRAGIWCQVSLEERMACGLGACYGCAIHLRDGRMVRSCVEGPVFNASEVDW